MEKVQDITSLEAYQNFKKAESDSEKFRIEREQRERKAHKLWDGSKAKRKEAEMASTLREAEECESEADDLKKRAKQEQRDLELWIKESPHYGNLRGAALKQLETEGKEFIANLFDRAQSSISDSCEVLEAINTSKSRFDNNTMTFIPKVGHALDELKSVKQRLKF